MKYSFLKVIFIPMWDLNSQSHDQEVHALLAEPARLPSYKILFLKKHYSDIYSTD